MVVTHSLYSLLEPHQVKKFVFKIQCAGGGNHRRSCAVDLSSSASFATFRNRGGSAFLHSAYFNNHQYLCLEIFLKCCCYRISFAKCIAECHETRQRLLNIPGTLNLLEIVFGWLNRGRRLALGGI